MKDLEKFIEDFDEFMEKEFYLLPDNECEVEQKSLLMRILSEFDKMGPLETEKFIIENCRDWKLMNFLYNNVFDCNIYGENLNFDYASKSFILLGAYLHRDRYRDDFAEDLFSLLTKDTPKEQIEKFMLHDHAKFYLIKIIKENEQRVGSITCNQYALEIFEKL
jgi:hypothetical protein